MNWTMPEWQHQRPPQPHDPRQPHEPPDEPEPKPQPGPEGPDEPRKDLQGAAREIYEYFWECPGV